MDARDGRRRRGSVPFVLILLNLQLREDRAIRHLRAGTEVRELSEWVRGRVGG